MGDVGRSELASGSSERPDTIMIEGHPEGAILFVAVSLILGVICRQLLKKTRVPYTVGLLILGFSLGALEYSTKNGLGMLGDSIRVWATINPELILFVFLPALLFESSFAMEVHQIKRCIMQMVLLAGPGVIISTACLALVNRYLFPYGWNWSTCLLLGGLLSATDPVAVVALLKELGASKKLRTIVEGESLMNDGTAIVVYKLFFKMVLGQHFTAGEILEFFARVSLGGVALGIGIGLVAAVWVGHVFNDTVIEITLTLTASYIAFFVAEDAAGVSGVLTVMTVGIFFAAFAGAAFSGESQLSMHHFWEMISYIANTLIFILSGTVIAESIFRSQDKIEAHDWGYLVLLYVFLQLSRAVVVGVLYPGLRYFGYGLEWKEAVILVWAGLRGAVALSLSLSVAQVGEGESEGYTLITKQTEARFVFFTGGIVLMTLIFNGTTTQFLLTFLRMDRPSEQKNLIQDYVRHQMYKKALDSYGELGDDEELGPIDWESVKEHIPCLGELNSQVAPSHPHVSASEEQHRIHAFRDTRIRFLNGVQAAYSGMLEEGRISRTAAILLTSSVNEGLDQVAQAKPLQDWKGVQPHVKIPKYLKWQSSKVLPKVLFTKFTVDHLELGCYMAGAFLRAHRQAQIQLREFIGESEIADAVIKESQDEGQVARTFLEDIRLSYPQVLRAIKTKQVATAVLVQLSTFVTSLEEAGLLDLKETSHLHDSVQDDLKKLHRTPPLAELPSAFESLNNHPFFGALPSHFQNDLLGSAREFMMLRESILYTEDTKAECVWFIANGNVKWSGQRYNSQHVLHPIFSHGTTLGLYEALTGKPLLWSVAADSVVHCFALDKVKLMTTLQIEPELEEFFWQESALVLAKVVAPQHFEAYTLHELRAMILDGSHMCTYLRGELIEMEVNKIGILLEGFVKQEGKNEVIGAPAGLLSPSPELHPRQRGSRSRLLITHSLYYHAEARSRVLFLDLHAGQSTPSLPSMNSVLPSQLSRERNMQMRIPESHSGNYSAHAMELSLFGSKIQMEKQGSGGESGKDLGGWSSFNPRSHGQLVRRRVAQQFSSAHSLGPKAPKSELVNVGQGRVQSQVRLPAASPFPIPAQTQNGYSSGESDTEEDHIVEIASPSNLFHTL